MKCIGYFAGVTAVALLSMGTYAVPVVNGSECCGTKAASADEKAEVKCIVCGKGIANKDQSIKVEHKGKTIHLCCESCADTFKKDPSKCMKDKEQK
jgi:YHS domain-containing protein